MGPKPRRKVAERVLRHAKELDTGEFAQSTPEYPGVPNPQITGIAELLKRRGELAGIVNGIKQVGSDYLTGGTMANKWDYNALMKDDRMRALRSQFDALIDAYEQQPPAKPGMPQAPSRYALYDRLAVGTRAVSLGFVPKEQRFIGTKEVIPVSPDLNCTFEEYDNRSFDVVVSFNTATQLTSSEMDKLDETDGLHICPDIPHLAEAGLAESMEDGKYTVTADTKTFVDSSVVLPDFKIKPGYMAFNKYASRTVKCYMTDVVEMSYKFQPQAIAGELSFDEDLGYKHDGVAVQLQVKGPDTILVDRCGRGYRGTAQFVGPACDFIVNCEQYPKQGWPRLLILQRVVYFRGFRPFHSGALLRYFTSKVKIRLSRGGHDDVLVYGPAVWGDRVSRPVYGGVEVPVDGIIIRRDQLDYYVKSCWTIDTDCILKLLDKIKDHGWDVIYDASAEFLAAERGEFVGGVNEYGINLTGSTVRLTFHCPRPDKPAPDSLRDIMYRIENFY